jgi:hypothetical protein
MSAHNLGGFQGKSTCADRVSSKPVQSDVPRLVHVKALRVVWTGLEQTRSAQSNSEKNSTSLSVRPLYP